MVDLNGSIFDGVNELGGHITPVDDAMVFAARYAVYAIIAIVVLSWFVRAGSGEHRRVAVYTAALSAVLALLVTGVIQHFYVHERPFVIRDDVVLLMHHGPDPSFPSEHASVAFALAAGLGLYRVRIGIVLLALAGLTAFARVYVGVHYPADVSAGALVGIGAALIVRFFYPALAWLDRTVIVPLVPVQLR
ncbi:MAG TPA: phosphatase PAP2 family protein [Dehalococcoidia bacterium]|jgi:undecaprenyl-diphosphatase|nr:phosphatase PAP2 family protein [Dehalococcoidia bacterium]